MIEMSAEYALKTSLPDLNRENDPSLNSDVKNEFVRIQTWWLVKTMDVASIQKFETQLEQLEVAARRGDSLPQLVQKVRSALLALTPKAEVVAVISEGDEVRLVNGTPPTSDCEKFATLSHVPTDGHEVAIEVRSAEQLVSLPGGWTIVADRILSPDFRFVAHFLVCEDPRQQTIITDASRTLVDILAEAASRRLLSDLSRRLSEQEQLHAFVHNLARAGTHELWAQEVVQRGVEYMGKGRISVLKLIADRWQLIAATGSTSINHASEAVRRNEEVAKIVSATVSGGTLYSAWIPTETPPEDVEGQLRTLLAQYAAIGVQRIRIEPISDRDGGTIFLVLTEAFQTDQLPAESLLALVHKELTDAARLLPQEPESAAWRLTKTPTRKFLLAAAVTFLLLLIIPADFEVEVVGQAFPQDRRRIFAPDDGIVERLLVTADEEIDAAEELLQLHNPARELERNRIAGEIESVKSRILAIRASRSPSVSGSGNNSPSRSSDLSSEEQQLEQKLVALTEEQTLIDQQIAALTLTAPIGGSIYQRRLQEQLASRPVQRGQLLLEIVNTRAREWELELQIPDSVVGYVQSAAAGSLSQHESTKNAAPGLTVQFTLASDLGEVHTTTLHSLDLDTHLSDGQLNVLATALIDKEMIGGLRPGQLVTARIDCGRRSLAFVLFREIIEFWQRKKFAWL